MVFSCRARISRHISPPRYVMVTPRSQGISTGLLMFVSFEALGKDHNTFHLDGAHRGDGTAAEQDEQFGLADRAAN